MQNNIQPRQYIDIPSALLADKSQSLICTLKVDCAQQIEDYLCIAGWATKPLKIHVKDKSKWKECKTIAIGRPDVEASIKAKPGSNLGFIAFTKKTDQTSNIQIKIESTETSLNNTTIVNIDLQEDSTWRDKISGMLEQQQLLKKKIKYNTSDKTAGHHPEGHGHIEIARKSRSFNDLVVIGWLSAKEDELFFIETDDGRIIPIYEAFRFFRQDIENTGLPASHGKVKEKAGFIFYIKAASKVNKIQLCGIHEKNTKLIHEVAPETVNESAENSIDWAKNIVHTSQDEYTSRLKYFEIPYQNTRLEKIKDLLKIQAQPLTEKEETTLSTIIIASDHWRTKTLITSLEANNSTRNQYFIIFQNKDEEHRFHTLLPSLSAAFQIDASITTATQIYETAILNAFINQTKCEEILIINDNINPNQPQFLQLAIKKIKSHKAFAVIPRQLDIYGEEYSAYIEVKDEVFPPIVRHRRKFIGTTPEEVNKAYNLDCVIFNRTKLIESGGIDNLPELRSPYPRPMTIIPTKTQGNSIFPADIYVTNLRDTKTITSSPPTELDLKNLVYLNLN